LTNATECSFQNGDFWNKAYRTSESLVTRKIAGQLFIVPISGELANMQRMFALTTVGERIWQLIEGRKSLAEIRETIVREYDVEAEQAESDIKEFVGNLLDAGLIAG
jgi:hypothetical protein